LLKAEFLNNLRNPYTWEVDDTLNIFTNYPYNITVTELCGYPKICDEHFIYLKTNLLFIDKYITPLERDLDINKTYEKFLKYITNMDVKFMTYLDSVKFLEKMDNIIYDHKYNLRLTVESINILQENLFSENGVKIDTQNMDPKIFLFFI
jgi:hypothetical protein